MTCRWTARHVDADLGDSRPGEPSTVRRSTRRWSAVTSAPTLLDDGIYYEKLPVERFQEGVACSDL